MTTYRDHASKDNQELKTYSLQKNEQKSSPTEYQSLNLNGTNSQPSDKLKQNKLSAIQKF